MDISNNPITGYGFATLASDGTILDARFRVLTERDSLVGRPKTTVLSEEQIASKVGEAARHRVGRNPVMDTQTVAIRTQIADLADEPVDRYDFFLRLYLLSNRHARPNSLNLGGLELYTPIAWTNQGPCLPEKFEEARWRSIQGGRGLEVHSVYHVPRMTDYVMPGGVRIMNTHSVRLGAYLSPGTMVTAAGFCNMNAGTLGPSMVEGQISRGVTVEAGSHVGAGAVLMGTTAGGGRVRVAVGKDCLIGANAGVGISLGDGCVVEAGCYVTAGAQVTTADGNVVKATELSERPNLLFRRNSISGRLEAVPSKGYPGLNAPLHDTDMSRWTPEAMLLR